MNKWSRMAALALAIVFLGACSSQADTVSSNLSTDADNYKITRKIVFYNGITNTYIAEVVGRCSLGNNDPANEVSYTCETSPGQYIKNFLHISDNVTWFALQVDPTPADPFHYKVVLKPEEILPDLQIQTSGNH